MTYTEGLHDAGPTAPDALFPPMEQAQSLGGSQPLTALALHKGLLGAATVFGTLAYEFPSSPEVSIPAGVGALVWGALPYAVNLIQMKKAQGKINECFEAQRLGEHYGVLWHPNDGESATDGVMRMATWLSNARRKNLLAVPWGTATRVVSEKQLLDEQTGVRRIDWLSEVNKEKGMHLTPRRPEDPLNDVAIATPRQWLSLLEKGKIDNLINQLRGKDNGQSLVRTYDDYADQPALQRTVVGRLCRRIVESGLNETERVVVEGDIYQNGNGYGGSEVQRTWGRLLGDGTRAQIFHPTEGIKVRSTTDALRLRGDDPLNSEEAVAYNVLIALSTSTMAGKRKRLPLPQKGASPFTPLAYRERTHKATKQYLMRLGVVAVTAGVTLISVPAAAHYIENNFTITTLNSGLGANQETATNMSDVVEWSLDANPGTSTVGYWTQGTSYDLDKGSWQIDTTHTATATSIPTQGVHALHTIDVTDQQLSWNSVETAIDNSNYILSVPVLSGMNIVSGNIGGEPIETVTLSNGLPAVEIPQNTPINATLHYELASSSMAGRPSQDNPLEIHNAGKIDARALQQFWLQKGIVGTHHKNYRLRARDMTNYMNTHDTYDLDSGLTVPSDSESWSEVIAQWYATGAKGFCETASTVLTVSNSDILNHANGYLVAPDAKSKDTLSTRHAHAWAVDRSGNIYDGTAGASPNFDNGFFQQVPHEPSKTAQEAALFVAQNWQLALKSIGGFIGAGIVFKSRRKIASVVQRYVHPSIEQKEDHYFKREQRKMKKLSDQDARTAYGLLSEIKYGSLDEIDLQATDRYITEGLTAKAIVRQMWMRGDLLRDNVQGHVADMLESPNGLRKDEKRTLQAARQLIRFGLLAKAMVNRANQEQVYDGELLVQ